MKDIIREIEEVLISEGVMSRPKKSLIPKLLNRLNEDAKHSVHPVQQTTGEKSDN